MKRRSIKAILLGMIVPMSMYAENISGTYVASDNPKEITISVVGKGEEVHPDKKGRFTIKNVDVSKDSLRIYTPYVDTSFTIALAHPQGAKHASSYIIKEFSVMSGGDTVRMVDVCYKPKSVSLSYSTVYGGTIITNRELEATGEQNLMAALSIKYQQAAYSTLNGSTTPLYFVDGVETNDISHYPVREIAYVEYVKSTNAASTSLGVRGANGAILLTTMSKYLSGKGIDPDPEEKHCFFKFYNSGENRESIQKK
ncbi:MAG: hypothetical protein IK017_03995 [Paludibacteraceae bacterium]|nr:hypothetical protein [Paludibacteraceae bacterium]